MLLFFIVYRLHGKEEAVYRTDAKEVRRQACLESPTFNIALAFPDSEEEYLQSAIGAEMAISEVNLHLNEDCGGISVIGSDGTLQQKKIKSHYYSYDMDHVTIDPVVDVARKISRDYSYGAVIGFYTSEEAYPAALIFQESGLLYLSPFSTSSRITNHNWPLVFRTTPNVDMIMSALFKGMSRLFLAQQEPIRLAFLYTNSIYGDDAKTAVNSHIANKSRLYELLRRTDALIDNEVLDGDAPLLKWLVADNDKQKSMLDELDISDKLFLIQALAFYGFTQPGVSIHDLDIDSLQEIGHLLFDESLTINSTIDSLRVLNPPFDVAFSGRFKHGDSDFSAQIRDLSKADADAIIILDYLNTTTIELLKEIQEAGIKLPIFADDGFEYPSILKEVFDENSNDMYLVSVYDDDKHGSILNEKYNKLRDTLPARYQVDNFDASYQTYQTYQTICLLAQAIHASKSTDPFTIASRIKNTSGNGWKMLNGTWFNFDDFGDLIEPEFVLKQYKNGKFERI